MDRLDVLKMPRDTKIITTVDALRDMLWSVADLDRNAECLMRFGKRLDVILKGEIV